MTVERYLVCPWASPVLPLTVAEVTLPSDGPMLSTTSAGYAPIIMCGVLSAVVWKCVGWCLWWCVARVRVYVCACMCARLRVRVYVCACTRAHARDQDRRREQRTPRTPHLSTRLDNTRRRGAHSANSILSSAPIKSPSSLNRGWSRNVWYRSMLAYGRLRIDVRAAWRLRGQLPGRSPLLDVQHVLELFGRSLAFRTKRPCVRIVIGQHSENMIQHYQSSGTRCVLSVHAASLSTHHCV